MNIDKDRINGILNKGIHCPICEMALIDLEHDGYEGTDPNSHDYFCTNCNIDIQIYNQNEE